MGHTENFHAPTALASDRAHAAVLRMVADVRGYLALGERLYREDYAIAQKEFELSLAELHRRFDAGLGKVASAGDYATFEFPPQPRHHPLLCSRMWCFEKLFGVYLKATNPRTPERQWNPR